MRRISEGAGRSARRAIISASSCHCRPQPNKRTASAITTCSGCVIVEADGAVEPTSAQLQQAATDGQLLLRVRHRDMYFYAALRK